MSESLYVCDDHVIVPYPHRCPFCGSACDTGLNIGIVPSGMGYHVVCYVCGTTGPTEVNQLEAVERWNGRRLS